LSCGESLISIFFNETFHNKTCAELQNIISSKFYVLYFLIQHKKIDEKKEEKEEQKKRGGGAKYHAANFIGIIKWLLNFKLNHIIINK
jgi:hypothetical protein